MSSGQPGDKQPEDCDKPFKSDFPASLMDPKCQRQCNRETGDSKQGISRLLRHAADHLRVPCASEAGDKPVISVLVRYSSIMRRTSANSWPMARIMGPP